MRVLNKNDFSDIFPMRVKCEKVVDIYGFSYGNEKDFCGSELEIDAEDIKRHDWFKYPCYKGTDYGVICPVCGKLVVVDTNKIPKRLRDIA
jgi:hypothetical protein